MTRFRFSPAPHDPGYYVTEYSREQVIGRVWKDEEEGWLWEHYGTPANRRYGYRPGFDTREQAAESLASYNRRAEMGWE